MPVRDNQLTTVRAPRTRFACAVAALALATVVAVSPAAHAFVVKLKGAAPDRIERQRAQRQQPHRLTGAPDPATLAKRLQIAGAKLGNRVFLRTFKAESELELWIERADKTLVKFATYPICFWSGKLGPKHREGDRQTPEGFYTITRRQLHRYGKRPRSLNLGFPNRFDRLHRRTGSYILVHGGCSSVGCYSMTDEVMDEIYKLARRALYAGQRRIHMHAFPFRMTEKNMQRYAASPDMMQFWRDLKVGYDRFEESRLPPKVGICGKRYVTRPGQSADRADPGAIRAVRRVRRDSRSANQEWQCFDEPTVSQVQINDSEEPRANPG